MHSNGSHTWLLAPITAAFAIAAIAGACGQPVENGRGSDAVFMAYDPANNPDAVLTLPRWEGWYYHVNTTYGDAMPNNNAVPVYSLRLRFRSPTMHGDMTFEIANAAGRFSSDAVKHVYDLRIVQTAWIEGDTSWPDILLGDVGSRKVETVERGTFRGFATADIGRIASRASAAAFGDRGETARKCSALRIEDGDRGLDVLCVPPSK